MELFFKSSYVLYIRDENVEKFHLSSDVVNQTTEKIGAQCFNIMKMLGKGGYGKVRGRLKWAWSIYS